MSYRKLDINGRTWTYKIGRDYLDIRNPEGKGFRPLKQTVGELVLRDPDDPSSGKAIMVTPRHVRDWIERNAT
jgi:hypothetical protein